MNFNLLITVFMKCYFIYVQIFTKKILFFIILRNNLEMI